MPAVCFLFRIHIPYSIKKITFFDFGEFPDLIDDNKSHQRTADSLEQEILPAIDILHELISGSEGSFKCSVYFSGIFLDLVKQFRPADQQAISAFLNNVAVEPVVSAYFHPLIPLQNPQEFLDQVLLHRERIFLMSGKKSCIYCSPDLLFHDGIMDNIGKSGFEGLIVRTAESEKKRKLKGTVFRHGGLKLLQVPEILSDGLYSDGIADINSLRKKLRQAARAGYDPVLVPVDLHGPDPMNGTGSDRIRLVKRFVSDVITSGEYVFLSPSEILNDPEKITEITEKDLVSTAGLSGTVLYKEARKYLYALEKKIKNTGDESLIYRWRILHSVEQLWNLLPATKDMSRENENRSLHEAYLDYMNALSCLDIYAWKIHEQIN